MDLDKATAKAKQKSENKERATTGIEDFLSSREQTSTENTMRSFWRRQNTSPNIIQFSRIVLREECIFIVVVIVSVCYVPEWVLCFCVYVCVWDNSESRKKKLNWIKKTLYSFRPTQPLKLSRTQKDRAHIRNSMWMVHHCRSCWLKWYYHFERSLLSLRCLLHKCDSG